MTTPEGLIPDMPIMPDMTSMALNPLPTRIAQATWDFWEALHLMEPSTLLGGIYANKAGYHNTRKNLLDQGLTGDYSIKLPDDKLGPADKAAGIDWTFPDAQAGNYTKIRRYGSRIASAYARRDPRLKGWREVLIQADMDDPPEGFDFVGWFTRTPDATHKWHGHFSILRRYINDTKVYRAMLSILKGQSLSDWLEEEGDMPLNDADIIKVRTAVLQALTTVVPWESAGVGQSAAAQGEGPLSLRKIIEYLIDDIRFSPSPTPVDTEMIRKIVREEIDKTRLTG